MRISEQLFDLGPAGLFDLTTDEGFRPPFPAQRLGRARLYANGAIHDRLEMCTRPVATTELERVIAEQRECCAHAVESVREYLDWAEKQVSQDFREAPNQAHALGDGLMLLGFTALSQPRIFRAVDVARGAVLWEATINEIRASCGLEPSPDDSSTTDHQLINAAGGRHTVLWINYVSLILEWKDGALRLPAGLPKPKVVSDFWATREHLLTMPKDTNDYRVIRISDGRKVAGFAAPTRSKGCTRPITSPGSERVVLPHDGGTVDVVDGFGESHFTIRPYPRTGRNESVACRLSQDGRWLTVRQWRSTRVVDLDVRKVVEFPTPEPLLDDQPGTIAYDSDVIARSTGVYVLHSGVVIHHPFESLNWQPVIEPGKRAAKKADSPELEKHIVAWRKPALALKPVKRGRARSHLYGGSSLRERDIPSHDGRPMLLLAAIDLAEVAAALPDNPWPKEGALYFFTAVDGDGEPLVDEMFNPAAVTVIWKPERLPDTAPKGEIPAQPLQLSVHSPDLPDIAAAIVEAHGLDDLSLEEYRAYLEKKKLSDQPNGHRLGGYPTILQNNDLEAQAAHFADGTGYPPANRQALREAARWRLLLQLDSDDVFMWGTDSGVLYFMIHDDDLLNKNFSRVVAVCEGY